MNDPHGNGMQLFTAVYVQEETRARFGWNFWADDLAHAAEQADDARGDGEYLETVTTLPAKLVTPPPDVPHKG